ncbi:MAG: QueT transporter family protein [Lachnospiraceae bacterium]|nr:QueT transporter family protein [Lachnospiraceae bacterium]MDD7333197.1 QueT transporter family protein [Lachnospiraceae bacterium]MDY3275437.1 QueT transporter family protein [Agathobacter sp.]MDY5103165.1 QueT transporter family protein [Agathobacter sp.]MDY5521895.1 QueT transporter family protein [Agathobacter sp.]
MRNKNVTFMVQAAIIAALYVVLTFVANALGLASHTIQVRFSEALCILPFFTPAAIPGLWIGCLIANLATGAVIWDIIFGSIATLLGAIGTYLLRRHKFLCTLPPVIANMIIVPFILVYGYGIPRVYLKNVDVTIIFNAMTVGIGEVISVCVLGSILLNVLNKYKDTIFRQNAD